MTTPPIDCVNHWLRLPTDLMIHITQLYLDDRTAHDLCKSSRTLLSLIGSRYEWKKEFEWYFYSRPSLEKLLSSVDWMQAQDEKWRSEYQFDNEAGEHKTPILLVRHSIKFELVNQGWKEFPPSFQSILNHQQDDRNKFSIGIVKVLTLEYHNQLDYQPIHLPHLHFIPSSVTNLSIEDPRLLLPSIAHLDWPKRLNTLHMCSCRPEWINEDMKDTWPASLTDFGICGCEDWIDPLDPRAIHLPNTVRSLSIYGETPMLMYDPPNVWSLPPNLTSLILIDIKFPLDGWLLPASLTALELEGDTHQTTNPSWIMPNGLLKLSLGGEWKQSLSSIMFNEHLTSLRFGSNVYQDLSTIEFPHSLKELIFGFYFVQPIIGVKLPPGLEVLTFSQRFNHPIYVASPPPPPRPTLSASSNINSSSSGSSCQSSPAAAHSSTGVVVAPWSLPLSLRKLTFGLTFEQEFPINKIHLPLLEKLTIRGECLTYHDDGGAAGESNASQPPPLPPSFHSSLLELFTWSAHLHPTVSMALEQCARLTTMKCVLTAPDLDDRLLPIDEIMIQRFSPTITDLELKFPIHTPALLNGVVFPPYLLRLTLSFPFSPPIHRSQSDLLLNGFPSIIFEPLTHLKELIFTNQFQESLSHIEFPESLLRLSLPSSYNVSLAGLQLPPNLTNFMLGERHMTSQFCYFDSLMSVLTIDRHLPHSLQDLTIPSPYDLRINQFDVNSEAAYNPAYKPWVHQLQERTVARLRIHFTR